MLKNKYVKLFTVFLMLSFFVSIVIWVACSKTGTINPIAPVLQVEIDSIFAYPPAITGGYSSNIYVHIVDQSTRRARSGLEVRFSTNYGVLVSGSDITDQNGWAQTTLQTPVDSSRHIATVTARVYETISKSVQVYIYETGYVTPTQIIITAEIDSVPADNGVSYAVVRARLLDENSNPIARETITFSAEDPEIVIEPLNGGITDSLGIARARIPSPSSPRRVRIYASFGSLRAYTDITFIERARITILNLTATSYRLIANGNDSTIIIAQAYTNYGTPAPDGTRIIFRTTAGTLLPLSSFKSAIKQANNPKIGIKAAQTIRSAKPTNGEVFAYTQNGIARVKLISTTTVDTAMVTAICDSARDTIMIFFDPGNPANITVVASNPTIIANGRDSTFIDAIVTDEFGNRARQGLEITFTTTMGTIEPSALTNRSGVARVKLVSGTNSGYATVVARWGTAVSGHTTVFFASTVASIITLQINPRAIVANGVSQATVSAQVLDRNFYPVSNGVPVVFETQQGTLSPVGKKKAISGARPVASSITTFTRDGIAEAILTSPTIACTSTVIAHSETSGITTAADTNYIVFLPGEPQAITVSASRETLVANGEDTCTISATVLDQFGNHLLSGIQVVLTASSGTITPDTAITDQYGSVRAILKSSRTIGRTTIIARVGSIIGQTYVYYISSAPAYLDLSATLPQIPADGRSTDTIIATVLDAAHYPVSDGTPVIFTVDNGTIRSAHSRAGKTISHTFDFLASRCVSFTRGGIAKAVLTSSTVAGIATVVATTDTTDTLAPTATVRVRYLPNSPYSITITTSRPSLVANGADTCTVEATVYDIFGNHLLAGTPVNFSVSSGNIIPSTVITDSFGTAKTTLRSGRRVERATITAQVDTIIRTHYINFTATIPAQISLRASSPAIPADGVSVDTIIASVFDSSHYPVSDGTPVLFSADNGLLSGVSGRLKQIRGAENTGTNLRTSLISRYLAFTSDGVAKAILRSSTTAGISLVVGTTDTVGTGGPADSIWIRFLPGSPTTIELTAMPDTIRADGVSRAEIRAIVYDAYHNRVGAGISVEFSTNLGTVSPLISITDSNGVATTYLTSSTTMGTATVQAISGPARGVVFVYLVGSTPARISLWSSIGTVQIGSGVTATIFGFVSDSSGRVVTDGTPVDFSASIGEIPLTRAYTSNGLVQVTYSPRTRAGIDTIEARSGPAVGRTTIRVEAGEVMNISLSAEPETIAADGRSMSIITAILSDQYGNRVGAGREVRFNVDIGNITPVAYTDTNGVAVAYLRGSFQTGLATVEARSGMTTAQTTVEFISSDVAFISLYSDSSRLTANGISSTRVIARLLDRRGRPCADGTIVIFHSYLAGTTLPFGTIDTIATSTGGEAIVSLRSPTQRGKAEVIASVFGLSDTIYIEFVAGPVARVQLDAEPDSIPADGTSQLLLTATLYDINSNRLGSGNLVVFTTTLGTLEFSQVYTDSQGQARTHIRSATTVGTAQVNASSGGYTSGITVWFTRITAASIALSAQPPRIPADGVSSSTIIASLLDSSGAAVPDNTPVRFSTTNGVLFPCIGYTIDGRTSVNLRSATTPGIATVTADAGGGVRAQTTVEFIPGGATYIEMQAIPSSIPANGDTFAIILATVYDQNRNPVGAGIPVRFTTTLGRIDSVSYTTAIGTAQAILRAGTIPGTAQIYATSGDAFGQTQVHFTTTEAASIYLTINPTELIANNYSTATITGIARNSLGLPITDRSPIELFVSPDSFGRVTPSIVYTDSGRFNSIFVAGRIAGNAYIIANAGSARDSVIVRLLPGEPESIYVELSDSAIMADSFSTATITARLFDRYGNPVGGGYTVNFSTNLGTISPASDITDRNGRVRATIRSGLRPGVATVRISSGMARREIDIIFFSSVVGTIILSGRPQEIIADGLSYALLEATVLDTLGNYISDNTPILFTAEPETLGYLVSRVGYTQDGKATSIFRAGRRTGEVTIEASSDTIRSTTTIRLKAGPVHSLEITATPNVIPADGRSSSRIEVVVRDAFGNNVGAGHSVSFTTTSGTLSPSTVYTNTNGVATTNLVSSTTPGTALLSVSCEGVWETIEITFIPTGAASMLLSANPSELIANGISQSIINVTVFDSAGNYVSDGTLIRFQVIKPDTIYNYGNIVSTRPTMGGTATTTYTSGTRKSSIYIKAMAVLGGDTLIDSVLIRLLPGPAATVEANADSTELHANGSSSTCISATIKDAFGNTLPGGTLVNFSTNLGTITPSTITDTSGVARVQLVAGYTTGDATITIRSGSAIGFVQVRLLPTNVSNIFVTVSKSTLVANGEDTTRVTANVHDPTGNLSSDNIIVNFEILPNGGYFLPNQVATRNGSATTILRADTLAVGQRTIRAYVVQGTDTIIGTTTVKLIAGSAANIEISAEDTVIPADGISTTDIYVTITDRFGNPVSAGTPVTFTTSNGTITGIAVTDINGRASSILTSSTAVGTALITARSGDAINYTQVRFSRLEARRIELLIIPHSLPGDGVSSAEIVATVLDSVGNPVSDRTRVRFFQDTTNAVGRIIPPTAYTTNGIARSTFYAPTDVGYSIVYAEAQIGVRDSFIVQLTAGPPSIIEFAPSTPNTLLADGSEYPISIFVYDSYRNPVALGTEVQFSTTRGTIVSPITVYSALGEATTFISSNEVGSAIITARSGTAVTSKRIDFIPIQGRYLYLSANPTTLIADGTTQSILTAVVVDSQYRPVSDGIPIFFYSYGSGRLERRTVMTTNGIASTYLTSGTITGKDTVIARLSPGIEDTVVITFIPGPPASIQFTTPPHNIYAGGDTTSFVVRVLDRFSNPVLAGTRVSFETTLGTITTYAVTDTAGYAQGTLTSGTAMGVAFITARSEGAVGYITVNILATMADTLILSANPLTITANGRDSSVITAMVLDTARLPVSDGTLVRFYTTKGILSSPAVHTLNGIARTALISTTTAPETAIVTARASITAIDTVRVAFRAGPPSIIEISASRLSVVADGLDTSTIIIQVRDEFGNRLGAGERVDLTATGGASITTPVFTDVNGVARAQFTSSRRPGWSQVVAYVGTVSGSITIGMFAADIGSVILTVNPIVLEANGTSRATVSVTVLDTLNRPAADGTPVWFDSLSMGIVIPQRVETFDGTATAQLTAFTQVGFDTLFAHATPSVFDSVVLRFIPGPPYVAIITPDTDRILADGISIDTIFVTVKDIAGHNVKEGYAIEFSVSPDYMGTIRSIAVTDNNGECKTIFRSSRIPGVATIFARYEGRTIGVAQIYCESIEAATIILASDRTVIRAGGNEYIDIQALVLDASGRPVSDSTGVFFSLTSSSTAGIIFPGWSQTISGIARTRLISTTNAGRAYVYATSGTAISDTLTIDITPSNPARIYFTSEPLSMVADGISTKTDTVYVEDAFGNRVQNALLSLRIGLGEITPTNALTDTNGKAIFTVRSPRRATISQVEIASGSVIGLKNVTFTPTPIENISISAYPTGLPATGQDTSSITALLTTADGRPVSDGIMVWFTTEYGFITPTDTTRNGVVRAKLISADTSCTSRVCVNVTDVSAEPDTLCSACTQVIFTAGPPDSVYAYIKRGTTLLPGDTVLVGSRERVKIVVIVKDFMRNPVAPGTIVHLSINDPILGSLSDTVTSTNASGACTTYFNAGTKAGIAWITATTDNGRSGQVYIRLLPQTPQSIELNVNPEAIYVRGGGEFDYSVITAYIVDRFGNAVRDSTKVVFLLTNYPGTGPGERPTLEPADPTNPLASDTIYTLDGRANVTLRAGNISGTVIVDAIVDTIVSRAPRITIRSGLPYRISLSRSDCNVPGLETDGLQDTITAIVMDRNNNPVASGTAVYFTARSGLIIGSDTTDANGFARTIWYSANPRPGVSDAGKVWIIAETRGEGSSVIKDSISFILSGRVRRLEASATPSSIYANGTSTSTITITARDANNNPVADMTSITLSASLGSVTSPVFTSGECYTSTATARYTSTTLLYDNILTSPTLGDSAIITITSGDILETITIYLETGDPSIERTTLTVPSSVPLGGEATVYVTVRDVWGNPLGGETVVLTASRGSVSGSPNTTNRAGVASFTYIAPGSGTSDVVTVTITRTGDSKSQTITLTSTKVGFDEPIQDERGEK